MSEPLRKPESTITEILSPTSLLISGRPLNVADHIDQWDAFAAIWLPGTEGDGVSDILFGDFSSTGRLSFPWPINTEEGSNADKDNLLFEIGYGLQ